MNAPAAAPPTTSKYHVVADEIAARAATSVLDVGCRDGVLGRVLRDVAGTEVAYTGLDLFPGPGVDVVHDLREDLPFDDGAFDVVAAVDVLEHLDDMQRGLDTLWRVARRSLLVVLPNTAHFLHRGRFLATGRLGGKFDLAIDAGPDRHRWVTVLPQTDRFIEDYASRHALAVSRRDLGSGARRSGVAERVLARAGAPRAWYVYATLYALDRERS